MEVCKHVKHWYEAVHVNISDREESPDIYRGSEWYGLSKNGKVEHCNG